MQSRFISQERNLAYLFFSCSLCKVLYYINIYMHLSELRTAFL